MLFRSALARREAVPDRPRRHARRADGHARLRPRRLRRRRCSAAGSRRLLGGTGALLVGADRAARGRPAPAPARPYGALLRRSGTTRVRARASPGRTQSRRTDRQQHVARAASPRARPRAAGRRRPRLPGRRLRRPHRAAAAPARPDEASPTSRPCLFDAPPRRGRRTCCRTARVLKTSPAIGRGVEQGGRSAPPRRSSTALAHFGVEATIVGQIAGPRVTRYELQLAPGTKVSKVAALKDDLSYALATTEIRILAPIPGKQAVGVEVPNLAPKIVTLGDIYDDLPSTREPARRLARQGHLRQRRLGRPRADAAHPHRRHDRLGQVRLHQHDPDLDPAPLDARTRCG